MKDVTINCSSYSFRISREKTKTKKNNVTKHFQQFKLITFHAKYMIFFANRRLVAPEIYLRAFVLYQVLLQNSSPVSLHPV